MADRTLPLELPEELVTLLGSPEALAAKAKEALVLQYQIPSGPATAEELRQETEDLRHSKYVVAGTIE